MSNFLSDVIDFSGAGLVYNPYGDESRFNGGLFGGGANDLIGSLKEEDTPASWNQAPEYPEAVAARELWWKTLQGYNANNNYGAIAPDWQDVWKRTQDRIHQSYWGSPTSIGLAGKVRASAARRNVSDSPALQTMLGRLGVQEQKDLQDLQTEQNYQQAKFGESARLNYLNQLASLSGRQPSAQYVPEEEGTNWIGELLKTGISALPLLLA